MTKKIDKDVVCLMPWIHTHIWPNGSCFPCCMSDTSVPFGNVNDTQIVEIINSDEYKEIRTQMLDGVKPKVCTRCYELEDTADAHTLRKNSLVHFKKYLHLFDETNKDGSIDDFKMRYMDIRFSNLCNMKCRTCGPELSSKWHDDQIKLFPAYDKPKFIDLESALNFMETLQPHLDYVDEVYFAGGEVLITPQHYTVLDYWLENNIDVSLRYTTNFSVMQHKSKSMFEYWNRFKDVRVSASLDTFGKRAEYARSGTNWDTIVSNRKEMMAKCQDTYFEITPTVGVFSVHSLFEFHKSWVDQGLLSIDNIRINILTHPRYFSITILPEEMKSDIAKIYTDYVLWLKQTGAKEETINAVEGIVDYMYSTNHSILIDDFKKHIETVDVIRNESFIEVYPEFKQLWQ